MILKRKRFICTLLMVWVSLASFLPAAAAAGSDSPAVFFPEKAFEFEPVIDGVKIVHDFTIMNKGSATLTIENVRTG